MLWTRFEGDEGRLRAQVHVTGPQPGDLVVVSDDERHPGGRGRALLDRRRPPPRPHPPLRLRRSDGRSSWPPTGMPEARAAQPTGPSRTPTRFNRGRKPMNWTSLQRFGLTGLLAVGLGSAGLGRRTPGMLDQGDGRAGSRRPAYSPPAGRNFPTRPFFGDTHLHTSFSMDAGAFGARLTPQDAYRFAKGEEITASSGQRVKLVPPARLPRRGRPLRQHGLLPATVRGQARNARRSDRAGAGTT